MPPPEDTRLARQEPIGVRGASCEERDGPVWVDQSGEAVPASVQTGAMSTEPAWYEQATAVPLAATECLGLGPFDRGRRPPPSKLTQMSLSRSAIYAAVETAGITGRMILTMLSWYRDELSEKALATEALGADPADLAATVDRLEAGGLVERSPNGVLSRTRAVQEIMAPVGVSLADQNAVTSDELGQICQQLRITPMPKRKQDRVDAITSRFADADAPTRLRGALSEHAWVLFERIAEAGGHYGIDPSRVRLGEVSLHSATTPRYAFARNRTGLHPEVAPLAELTANGIIGLAEWDRELWIWREAWPLLDRPLYRRWPHVPQPSTAAVRETGLRLPPLVGAAERALQHWDETPPVVLKNGELRLAKTYLVLGEAGQRRADLLG